MRSASPAHGQTAGRHDQPQDSRAGLPAAEHHGDRGGDIDPEIARAALAGVKPRPDGSPDVQAWLELVTKKQGIPLEVYRNDVVWPVGGAEEAGRATRSK